MNQDIIRDFIGDIGLFIKSIQENKKGIRGVRLDTPSLLKFKSLEEFLPNLEKLKERAMEDLRNEIPKKGTLKQQYDEAYNEKNHFIERINHNKNHLSKLESDKAVLWIDRQKDLDNLDALYNSRRNAEKELEEKRERLKMACVPFYGLIIIKELQRIENEDIPNLTSRINEYNQNIRDNEMRITALDQQINDNSTGIDQVREILARDNEEYAKCEKAVNNICQSISQHVKNLTYLTILENKMNESIVKGTVTSKVMSLLDMEPDIIHYDDDKIYFDLIDQWAQTKNDSALEEFYMKAEKEFFSHL